MRAYLCLASIVCVTGCGSEAIAGTPTRTTGAAGSCAAVAPAAQFAAARRVFVGVMLPGRATRLDGRRVLASPAKMRVTRYLKGDGPSDVMVLTAVTIERDGVTVAEDRIEPRAGERWKIYTGSRRQPFATSICAGSARVAVHR